MNERKCVCCDRALLPDDQRYCMVCRARQCPEKHGMSIDRTHDNAYLRLFNAMSKIAEGFQTPDELLQDDIYQDMDPLEILSMAYENIQEEAQQALDFARALELKGN